MRELKVGDKVLYTPMDDHHNLPANSPPAWPGVVREQCDLGHKEAQVIYEGASITALLPTVTKRLFLDVKHPNGVVTFHYPLEGTGAVTFDASGTTRHTWRYAEGN